MKGPRNAKLVAKFDNIKYSLWKSKPYYPFPIGCSASWGLKEYYINEIVRVEEKH
jgi:hypothetical protein